MVFWQLYHIVENKKQEDKAILFKVQKKEEEMCCSCVFRKSSQSETEEFYGLFNFTKAGGLKVGIERECFVADAKGNIVPEAENFLSLLTDRSKFGYELSACQLEDRIGPVDLGKLLKAIIANDEIIHRAEKELHLRRVFLGYIAKVIHRGFTVKNSQKWLI
jgi:hypothetical protein